MAWPLTGRALADFNRMLNDWKQYKWIIQDHVILLI